MKRIKKVSEDPTLYLVSTPIGNVDELSPRALSILRSVDYIASEDTRTTSSLLTRFDIKQKYIAYHKFNEQEASVKIISLIKEGSNIALTSDAGYPGLSDPGQILVRKCIDNDIPVVVINGSNALLPALIASGLDTHHFYFHGFLESKESQRNKELEELKNKKETLVFYESPHRIIPSLKSMYKILGSREACIAREITKLHEEYIHGTLDELITLDEATLKGEMVIIVDGNKKSQEELSADDIKRLLKEEIKNGSSIKEAVNNVSNKYNLKKNQVYKIAINLD